METSPLEFVIRTPHLCSTPRPKHFKNIRCYSNPSCTLASLWSSIFSPQPAPLHLHFELGTPYPAPLHPPTFKLANCFNAHNNFFSSPRFCLHMYRPRAKSHSCQLSRHCGHYRRRCRPRLKSSYEALALNMPCPPRVSSHRTRRSIRARSILVS